MSKCEKVILSVSCNLVRSDNPLCADDIPESFFRQMTTCQTAANEFLRQFWLAIYPPANEVQVASVANSAQKAAKAAKMIGYLEKTPEKVEALVRAAPMENVDPSRVQVVSFWRGGLSVRSIINLRIPNRQ